MEKDHFISIDFRHKAEFENPVRRLYIDLVIEILTLKFDECH